MLTLQILDQGRTFVHSLHGEAVVLGSDEHADISINATGVAARHARIEWVAGQPHLIAVDGEILRDGQAWSELELTIGDRIELGGVLLVVGQGEADEAAERPRARRARQHKRSKSWVPYLVAGLAMAGILYFALSQDGLVKPVEFVSLDRMSRAGKFEQAHAELASLRAWAGEEAPRQQLVEVAADFLNEVESAVGTWQRRIEVDAADQSYAAISRALQQDEKRASRESGRIAARIVRASLSEAYAQAKAAARRRSAANLADRDAVAGAGQVVTEVDETPSTVLDPTQVLADADRFAQQGLYGQALSTVRAASGGVAKDQVPVLLDRADKLRVEALVALATLLNAARQQAEDGDLAGAIGQLTNSRHRFPDGEDFAGLPELLLQLRQRHADAAVADAPTQQPSQAAVEAPAPKSAAQVASVASLASISSLLQDVQTREFDGDFAGAEVLVRRAGDLVRERDPDFGGRLDLRADELALLASMHEDVGQKLVDRDPFGLKLISGRIVLVDGIEGSELSATSADGPQKVSWLEIDAEQVGKVAEELELEGRPLLGAAMLLYRLGDADGAEAMLAAALAADAGLKSRIDRAIAWGRGDGLDPDGYTLTNGEFLSARQIEAQQTVARLTKQLPGLLRQRDPQAREAFLGELLVGGDFVTAPVAGEMRHLLEREIEQLERSSLSKQIDKLAVQHELLEAARAHAKGLIFDVDTYFYPYRPPQVSADRFAEYQRVQADVNERVAQLRDIWKDRRVRVRVPKKLQTSLDRVDWLVSMLEGCGELDESVLAEIAWVRALPPGDVITVGSYCRTVAEREKYTLWQRIQRYNDLVAEQVSVGEFALVRITNDYRVMFGHRPLALHPQVAKAAHGHAEEMSKLGYFSHFSPTEGRRTPFDRMKLEGYVYGVSENIAGVGSAESAHHAWCRSSGHHRNLLSPSHAEFGVGNVGRYWVQNFGGGMDYRESEEWRKAGEQ